MGRCLRAVRPGSAIQAPTVGDPYCRGRIAAAVLPYPGKKTVPAAQQSVLGHCGVLLNRPLVPEDKVAVPSVQADVRQWEKKRRWGCAALLPASHHSQRQANRHQTPNSSYQPDQKVCLPTKDLLFQGRPVTESDLVPTSKPPPPPQVVDGGLPTESSTFWMSVNRDESSSSSSTGRGTV